MLLTGREAQIQLVLYGNGFMVLEDGHAAHCTLAGGTEEHLAVGTAEFAIVLLTQVALFIFLGPCDDSQVSMAWRRALARRLGLGTEY